ncbi:hypothetical protein [Pseudoalteromonas maricaloris]|uniref:Uncharacterized protein n=2 Tax=Pseudoalteromonas maricaloris TaxID=184924 RepID=A0ABZ0M646_9GAMM|nr:hypothetical protein [Pseudoalteromonas maricaloris]WOX26903.1 hypothetical protein R5H13_09490 [Pseudoalteromonas maricaloris]WOX31395.1 hypothetical protein R5H13_20870 [Pseudoalteromonas maricaloris]
MEANQSEMTAEQIGAQSDAVSLQDSAQLQEFEYSHLASYTGDSAELDQLNESTEVTESEVLTDDDMAGLAAIGVDQLANFVESSLTAPVTIDNKTREVIAARALPVIKKHCKGGKMPPWLAKYGEEIQLGVVLATTAFSLFVQVRKLDAIPTPQTESKEAQVGN